MSEVSGLGSKLATATRHELHTAEQVFEKLQGIRSIGETTQDSSEMMAESSRELHSLGEQLEQLAKSNNSGSNNADAEDREADLF